MKTDDRYLHSTYLYFLVPAVHRIIATCWPSWSVSPFGGAKGDAPTVAILQDGDTYAVGIKMFSEYLLQFEIVGVFLLGAIIGAIVLAKTPKPVDRTSERVSL